jgi:CheY-like chemotaxis protein
MPDTTPRILVIEKDGFIQGLIRDVLERDGYRTLVTEHWLDPEDVRQLHPAVMLLDPFVDGGSTGWDYLRMLRAQPGMQLLPVIVCTGDHERLRELTTAELALVSTVILKPLDLDELQVAINAAMRPIEVLKPLPWPGSSEVAAASGDD